METPRRIVGPLLVLGALLAAPAFGQNTAPAQPAGAPTKPAVVRPKSDLPSAADVQNKYIEVTGGREKFEKIICRQTKATLAMPSQNISAPVEVFQGPDNKFRQVIDIKDIGKIEQGSDGQIVWETSPQGPRLVGGPECADLLRANNLRIELDLAKAFPMMDCIGVEKVGDRDAYKVLLIAPDGSITNRFYDKQSGLLVRETRTIKSQQGAIPTELVYEDYRDTGGTKTAFITRQTPTTDALKGFGVILTITSIEYPASIDPKVFELPDDIKKLVARIKGEDEPAPAPAPGDAPGSPKPTDAPADKPATPSTPPAPPPPKH